MAERALCNRRKFLACAATLAAGWPLAEVLRINAATEVASPGGSAVPGKAQGAKVAIVRCTTYGPEVKSAMKQAFDLLGGIGSLVKNRTVTVKINLTGTNLTPFLDRPVGESYMTHYATALALAALLFEAGAKRVRFVESTGSRAKLESTLALADWDINAMLALGKVEFENTRNLGLGKSYSTLRVPGACYLFSSFDLNHSYSDTDVFISLTKLKQHVTAGVTLSMKNVFGITPNSLYGGEAGHEEATEGRWPLHSLGTPENPTQFVNFKLPGAKPATPKDPGQRIPRIIADLCAARPIHLAIIDGITAMNGGEGPWCTDVSRVKLMSPGVIIAGLNPVATDAVGTAVMGYPDPRAKRGVHPFENCENHLRLAEEAGLGTADLARIEVLGTAIAKVACSFG